MLPFTRLDLERLFPPAVWQKAEDLSASGSVVDTEMERDGKSIVAKVKGERRTPYLTRIKITNGRGGRVRLTSTCTCLTYSECEHAASALLSLLEQVAAPEPDEVAATLDGELESWLGQVANAAKLTAMNGHADGGECVLYLLEPAQRSWHESGVAQPLAVTTARARALGDGVYGREQTLSLATLTSDEPPPFIRLEDQIIGRLLSASGRRSHEDGAEGGSAGARRLGGSADSETLRRMLETGRCHWRNGQNMALTFGGPRPGRFGWRFDSEGQQHVTCTVDDAPDDLVVVGLGTPWYIDLGRSEAGPITTSVPERLAQHLLRAPAVPATAATLVRQRLQPNATLLPLPESLKRRDRVEVRPSPVLYLHCPSVIYARGQGYKREEQELDLPLARVTFDYAGYEVGWQDGRTELNHVAGSRLMVMPRDTVFEVGCIEELNALGLQPLGPTGMGRFAPENCRQDFTFEEDEEDGDIALRWIQFNDLDLPRLLAKGWKVAFDASYPYRVAQPRPAWNIEIDESGMDWFSLDIGIDIGGERVPLLPILLDLFQRSPADMTPAALARAGEQTIYGELPDGRLVPIPASRLKGVVEALYELLADGTLKREQVIKLSRAEATRLAALRRALPRDGLTWSGGDELRIMAERLTETGELPLVPQPAALQATLRPYQQQGLSWLQFLSSCGLSGILADDMGLGKTLQTLAHILSEKQYGRLDRPALIVAPTSLIPTWRNELRKFAPGLRLLVLHGGDRRELWEQIDTNDVVLTSYALLIRDKENLVHRRWHMVALDEAQAIKNPTTKLARTAREIKADQRLALTGTPIENHLGELWSVFDFLMPGFLGSREQFRRIFRTPIEREGDTARQQMLVARVRPFMLRREKMQVAGELPPKSEFLREIELSERQRDLYESVRVAMSERIRDEISEKGIAGSSIAILEALLKLRQVCCDPRLLKNEAEDEEVLPAAAGGRASRSIAKAQSRQQRKHADLFDPMDEAAEGETIVSVEAETGEAGEGPGSAKFGLLMEMLPSMVETGRRIIVFSQFVEMLDLIGEGLTELGVPFVKLTGRTRDRETPVRRFQNEEVPIFLISLKAGGVGLTLTAADTVIHYDPWWNPAVEAQATDRAHRIGQKKSVFVYKLIAAGTVEEKMVELQARKRALYEGVLGGGNAPLTFTEEDIDNLFAPLPA